MVVRHRKRTADAHIKHKNSDARKINDAILSEEIRRIEPNSKDCDGCWCFDCANRGKHHQCDECPCPAGNIEKTSCCDLYYSRARANSLAKTYCRLFRISAFYHLTSWKNLESILRLGLLCRNRVESQGINHEGFAYESALKLRMQKRIGIRSAQDYVPLFFHQLPPILRKLEHVFSMQEIVYICVSPEILGEAGVYFTDKNLASTGCQVFDNVENLPELQWRIIQDPVRAYPQTEESYIQGAEVLVPGRIDPSWFTEVVVYEEEMKTQLRSVLLKTRTISIEVKPEFYF